MDEESIIEQPNEDINVIMQNYKKNKKNYKTTPTLTKYEKTRVLSERASQINDGSQALINIDKLYCVIAYKKIIF